MKFKTTAATPAVEILANDHYVAVPYDCSNVSDSDGVIKAGTVIPTNDDKAIGVLLSDVVKADNPNGTVVIHGFIVKSKMPTPPDKKAITALTQITFTPAEARPGTEE